MSDLTDTQLPPTAPPLAKALDILEERLFGLPVQMITKDPATADIGLLDHLAWEHSVDVWDVEWPESVKRSVISASAEVHRHKGTPFAVRRVVQALGYDASLAEWWDYAGDPGTFRISIDLGDPMSGAIIGLIGGQEARNLVRAVTSVAPVSRSFQIQVSSQRQFEISIGRGVRVGSALSIGHEVDVACQPAGQTLAVGIHRRRHSTILPADLTLGAVSLDQFSAGAVHISQTFTINHEVN
ncbi:MULTISPECIES: phage tail protein I [Phaeobacter]|uniref:phage tail protein I n=1 Tax=Phaeobacter TaxID=302485 RepID=UPI000694282D|nr:MULTISPECIES: phage tail protein I [Phaeobacter]AUQ89404.1 phage tail protein I [Phaeobacter inhibens]